MEGGGGVGGIGRHAAEKLRDEKRRREKQRKLNEILKGRL